MGGGNGIKRAAFTSRRATRHIELPLLLSPGPKGERAKTGATSMTRAAALQLLVCALVATSVSAAYDGSLFSWHPILMSVSVAASLSAMNAMKAHGLRAHAAHSSLQMVAVWCMIGGLIVMYRVKEEKGGDRGDACGGKRGQKINPFFFITSCINLDLNKIAC